MEEGIMSLLLETAGISGYISGIVAFITFWGVLISAIQAFFGYKLMRLWIIVEGVIAGAFAGVALGCFIGINISYSATVGWILFGLFAGAVFGGYIAYRLWKVGCLSCAFVPAFWPVFLYSA